MTRPAVDAALRSDVADVVYAAALALDANDFDAFLALAGSDFHYRIEAYSPDLRKTMTWLDHDRRGLAALIDLLPRHHVDGAQWLRHVVVYRVASVGPDRAQAVSSVALFHTAVDIGDPHLDGGSSRLFAVGRYYDDLVLEGSSWRLAARTVRLDTRQLGIGTHLLP
ncbi:MAG TPA: nuclear transport factor 2 family protein [Kofleriaceae bacterium]|jgi:methanesulfonate monooxygenase small subunit|nr:nuclear transport factor 2 family protein [Kofleriaceae bacterium]